MMPAAPEPDHSSLRRGVYGILIAVAVGALAGRILAVNAVDKAGLEDHLVKAAVDEKKKALTAQGVSGKELDDALAEHKVKVIASRRLQRPFLSANDRSRWCTVRALVEHGTYQIDEVIQEPGWDTIDMVKHDDEGKAAPLPEQGHLYSSKPPLLATLMAGEYWVIHKLTGWTLGTHPYEIGRIMLLSINGLSLLVYLLFLGSAAERLGTTDWGRIFVVAAGALGTFLTTFGVVINNHTIAAASAMICLAACLPIWYDDRRELWRFAAVGFFAALTAANELPALAFFGLLGLAFLVKWPRETLLASVPAAALVAAAYFGTNYASHGTLVIPYGQRSEDNNWYDYKYVRNGRELTSYWSDREKRSPIDQGEEDPGVYAMHVLVGHHGIFSLTPLWLLSVLGLALMCREDYGRRMTLAAFIFILSAVCIAFFLLRPLQDRNYGGSTSGFRWAFWLAPMWLMAMFPAADWCSESRLRRGVAYVLLSLSALSASYPIWNPWTHPWLMNFLAYLGLVRQ